MFKCIKENPVAVLGIGLIALVVWVAADLATAPRPKRETAESFAPANELPLPGSPTNVVVADGRDGSRTLSALRTTVSADVLPNLKPGMNRHEVEGFLGSPAPDRIQTIIAADGRKTYSTAYEFGDLAPPMTIRPIQPMPRPRAETPHADRLTIAFVFDATKPGHPLIDIIYPDPLF